MIGQKNGVIGKKIKKIDNRQAIDYKMTKDPASYIMLPSTQCLHWHSVVLFLGLCQ